MKLDLPQLQEQRVLVLGRGTAAAEVARAIRASAAEVHVAGLPRPGSALTPSW